MPSDKPSQLSSNIETINLTYVQWACECARWIEPNKIEQNPDADYSQDCIFLDGVEIPEFGSGTPNYGKILRVTGSYYYKKGITESGYLGMGPKPSKARVFNVSSFELVE